MPLFGHPEYQIGRGEIAESRMEVPFFALFMGVSGIGLLIFHLYTLNLPLTIALSISFFVFGATVVRVEVGVAVLIVAMLLSPEIESGPVGLGTRSLSVRYDDVLIMVVFLGVLTRKAWEGKNILWRPSPVNMPICLFFSLAVFSSLRAWRLSLGFWDKQAAFFILLKMAEFYMIFFLVGNSIRGTRQARWLLALFFAVSISISVYGMYSIGAVDRVSAPFETGGTEPNTLGGYLMIVMGLACSLVLYAPTRKARFLCAIPIVAAAIPFLHTLSRASYLALIVTLFAVAQKGRSWLVAVVTMAILVVSPLIMPQEVLDRVNYTFQRGSGEKLVIAGYDTGQQVDKSTHERIYVWGKVKYNLNVWPWFGGGVAWDNVLDSQYARVIIETGIIGFFAFLFMQYRILRTTSQAHRWSQDWVGQALGLGATAITIGLIVHSMGTISFLIVRIMEPYWFVVALAVVARSEAVEQYMLQRDEEAALASQGEESIVQVSPAYSQAAR